MISDIIISYRDVSVSSLRVEIASATYYAAVVGDRGWGLVGSAGSCGVRRELFMLFPSLPIQQRVATPLFDLACTPS